MESKDREVIQLELKYCERCGGLWLRRVGVVETYCAACLAAEPEYRALRKARRRVPPRPLQGVHAQFEVTPGFLEIGGEA
jgi:hypothetical protein